MPETPHLFDLPGQPVSDAVLSPKHPLYLRKDAPLHPWTTTAETRPG